MSTFNEDRSSTPFISWKEGSELFAIQVGFLPGITQEIARLSRGNPVVVKGIMEAMGRAISADPMAETNIPYIRTVLQAPGDPCDPTDLEEWQRDFIDANRSDLQT